MDINYYVNLIKGRMGERRFIHSVNVAKAAVKLAEIYGEINKMEKAKTTIDSFPVYKELFGGYALTALICLMLELLARLLLRRLP